MDKQSDDFSGTSVQINDMKPYTLTDVPADFRVIAQGAGQAAKIG